jgi:hypothetical protein
MAERDKMEAASAVHAYAEYKNTALFLTRRLGSNSRMVSGDSSGRTHDDYLQELRLKAVEVATRFQGRAGFCLRAERRYVKHALWNQARDWGRAQARRRQCGDTVSLYEQDELALGSYSIEKQLEARQLVRLLGARLSLGNKRIWKRLAAENGDIRAAWDPEIDGSLQTFRRRVSRLRAQACLVLQSLNKVGVDSRVWR